MVSKNSGTPKWMVYNGKPYEQMDDLGGKNFSPYVWVDTHMNQAVSRDDTNMKKASFVGVHAPCEEHGLHESHGSHAGSSLRKCDAGRARVDSLDPVV